MASKISVSPLNGLSSNAGVHVVLGRLVADNFISAPEGSGPPVVGSLTTNYFSFTFRVDRLTPEGCCGVFVKVPKMDLRRPKPSILPIGPDDRQMANEEVRSLRVLARRWRSDDLGIRWVCVRGYVTEFNAIVTDRAGGEEAWEVFRRLDLRRRLGMYRDSRRLSNIMARMGTALGRFHRKEATIDIFRMADEIPKLEYYCQALGVDRRGVLLGRVVHAIRNLASYETEGVTVCTLKGIDIRNALIDHEDTVTLLDPGRMKSTFREADLARFLMTYRILFWGSYLFAFGACPDPGAEAAFLDAYYKTSGIAANKRLLSFFFLKEQLKHWYTATDSLKKKSWPPVVKRLVMMLYINPFYTRQVARQLEQLTR